MAAVCCCPTATSTKFVSQQLQACLHSSSVGGLGFARLPQSKVSGLSTVRIGAQSRGGALVVRMGIRAVESFDATFQLTPESDQLLRSMLSSESFIKSVARDCALGEDAMVEFSGEIFQPVPWSQTTKHGMLPEFEKYHHDKENYVIINVPPQIMFKAKIFKPSRLCAIFKKSSPST